MSAVIDLYPRPDPYALACRVEAQDGEIADLNRRLALAEQRADRAERWLRRRVVERAWPTVCGGIAGGFALVGLLRIAGL